MWPEQLALVHGDDVGGRVVALLLSLPDADDGVSVEARLTLDPLHLEPVVEAHSGGQRLVPASVECPAQAKVDVLVDLARLRLAAASGGETTSPDSAVAQTA